MELHVDEAGHGVPVVLLHGAPTSPDHWAPLAARLGHAHRTLLVHLPGYGHSATAFPGELDESHRAVERALMERNVTEAHFVGFSGGSYRAFAIACRRNVRALSVVALGPVANFTPEEAEVMRHVARLLVAADGARVVESLSATMLSPNGCKNADWVRETNAWGAATSRAHLAAELDAFAGAPDLRDDIARLDVPVLLRVGELDVSTPKERARRIVERAPRALLSEVANVGHALLLEDFEGTASAIERHLAST